MSSTTVIYPIVTALVKAEEIIGPERAWQAVNSTQALFLSEFFASCRQESLSIAEIESIASFTADDINRFLRERGFRIQLAPFRRGGNGREHRRAPRPNAWQLPTHPFVQRLFLYPALPGASSSRQYSSAHPSVGPAPGECSRGSRLHGRNGIVHAMQAFSSSN